MEIKNETRYSVETMPTTGPDEKPALVVMIKGTFEIQPDKPAIIAAEQLPVWFADELFDPGNGGSVKFETDIAPFKPRADVALIGQACAPGMKPAEFVDVSMRVGSLRKELRVFGNRHWQCLNSLIPATISKPEPLRRMNLIYEDAFGGIDKVGGGYCPENIAGKGFYVKKSKKALHGSPLPNIEDPTNLISAWDDHPTPAGFGYISKGWQPRLGHIGTYDEAWQTERAPKPPLDFRYDFHNAAHRDLQIEGYLRGDEDVELTNLTADGYLNFKLPGVKVKCAAIKSYDFIKILRKQSADMPKAGAERDERAETVPLNLDTLCIMPDEMKLYMVWRGLCPIIDMTALEVTKLEVKHS